MIRQRALAWAAVLALVATVSIAPLPIRFSAPVAALAQGDSAADDGESTDLAAREPAKLAELKSLLERRYRDVVMESPTWPAWTFTNAEGKRIEWPEYTRKKPAQR